MNLAISSGTTQRRRRAALLEQLGCRGWLSRSVDRVAPLASVRPARDVGHHLLWERATGSPGRGEGALPQHPLGGGHDFGDPRLIHWGQWCADPLPERLGSAE
jgi:hypothetical protein